MFMFAINELLDGKADKNAGKKGRNKWEFVDLSMLSFSVCHVGYIGHIENKLKQKCINEIIDEKVYEL